MIPTERRTEVPTSSASTRGNGTEEAALTNRALLRALLRDLEAERSETQALRLQAACLSQIRCLVQQLFRVTGARLGRQLARVRTSRPQQDLQLEAQYRAFQPCTVHIRHSVVPQRPRVLHAVGNFYTGGSARLVVDLIEHLGHRYEQRVLVRSQPSPPEYVGLQIEQVSAFRSVRAAVRYLGHWRPNLLHVHFLGVRGNDDWFWYARLLQAAERLGCHVIENVNIPATPYYCDAVTHYVFVSDYVRYRFGRERDHNLTVYPGSDFDRFAPQPGSAHASHRTVGMAYRLEPDKLDPNSIDVLVGVLRQVPDARALVVGGGRLLASYQERAQNDGVADRIEFTGYVGYERLPELLARMTVFVAPVHAEAFGHVTSLAMGVGVPVVGYEVGALPEIVEDASLLVPPGDVNGLADLAARLLTDNTRRTDIARRQREHAERFSLITMIRRYEQLYAEITA